MPDEESELAQATRHVAAAEKIVTQQRERIAKLKATVIQQYIINKC
jgi:hypothetical protein